MWFLLYRIDSSGRENDDFNELDTQDHVTNREKSINIDSSSPTISIGWVKAE